MGQPAADVAMTETPEHDTAPRRRRRWLPLIVAAVVLLALLLSGLDEVVFRLAKERFAEELGDLLWYLTNVATKFGLSLTEIAENNLWWVCLPHLGKGGHRASINALGSV